MAVQRATLVAITLWLGVVPNIAATDDPAQGWCANGAKIPDFAEDGGEPSISVIVAQAALFSNSPTMKRKLGLFGLFHTVLVFRQDAGGQVKSERYWTLEFDATTNVAGATLPHINGSQLTWHNDARFCLTQGILWGREHWHKSFEVVTHIHKDNATRLFERFLQPLNHTGNHTWPKYQLWHVVTRGSPQKSLIGDLTCGDGVNWALHYLRENMSIPLVPSFRLRYSRIQINAVSATPVNRQDAGEWQRIVEYFQGMALVVGQVHGASILGRIIEFLRLMPVAYIYDGNSDTYYKLHGNRFLWIRSRFSEAPLQGPPKNPRHVGAQITPTVDLLV